MPDSALGDEPRRAAIYARFSTDLQNPRSTEDQAHVCREFGRRNGLCVVSEYRDDAKSGASLVGRDNVQNLLADAGAGKFDVVIVEHLDRLSRDMEDMAAIHKRLAYLSVDIISVQIGGVVSTAMVGLQGMFAHLAREDNVHKVRRGMSGLIRQGLSAGGKAYGYRPDTANRGKLVIVEEEARVVMDIFEGYASGRSPRALCRALNRDYVRAPRGKAWSPSALVGWGKRGTGMLRNPIYTGQIVWNKNRMIKNPDTGKRVSRPNPESEWQTAEIPELRIVPSELFKAVQMQLLARTQDNRCGNIGKQRRPKRLLSGLLKCGACGSGMAVAGVDKSGRSRLRCSAHTNSGTCPYPKTFYLAEVEDLVLESLTKELASPDQIKVYAERFIKARIEEDGHENSRRAEIEARTVTITKDNERLLDMLLKDVGDEVAIAAKMKAKAKERDELEQELASLPVGSNIVFHPSAIKRLAEELTVKSTDPLRSTRAKLELTLSMLDDMNELSPIVRKLIHSITPYRDESDGRLAIKVEASLAPFLQQNGKPMGAVPLVAEEGFEPPTQGL